MFQQEKLGLYRLPTASDRDRERTASMPALKKHGVCPVTVSEGTRDEVGTNVGVPHGNRQAARRHYAIG